MLFVSYAFLGFLIVLFLVYYLIPQRFQWQVLLLASYLFYCVSGIKNLMYILVTTITVYIGAIYIEHNALQQKKYLNEHQTEMTKEERKAYRERRGNTRFRWLIVGLVLNIGILTVVKYGNFLISNFNWILKGTGNDRQISFLTVILPMGISFYTFQALGYLIDVYRTTIPAEKNIFKFALFISFFPQVIQGPISRYGDLSKTLYGGHSFKAENFCRGLQRMLWGYFKKMVIADRIMTGVSTIIQNTGEYRGAYCFIGMLFYTIELYADFTGGIDITIGIAEAMGIRVQENFIRPYFSKSLKEYWRRWHISLCSWFRDYIFYPVSSSKMMRKIYRLGRRLPVYIASFIVWFVTGIWHGASWNFVVWGIANWIILMVSEELEPLYERFHVRYPMFRRFKAYQLFEMGRTFMLVCCLNLFDCYENVLDTFRAFGSILTVHNWNILLDGSLAELGLSLYDYLILSVGILIMVMVSLLQRGGSVRTQIARLPYPIRFVLWYSLFLIVLLMGAYGIGYDANQFIYNQF